MDQIERHIVRRMVDGSYKSVSLNDPPNPILHKKLTKRHQFQIEMIYGLLSTSLSYSKYVPIKTLEEFEILFMRAFDIPVEINNWLNICLSLLKISEGVKDIIPEVIHKEFDMLYLYAFGGRSAFSKEELQLDEVKYIMDVFNRIHSETD